VSANAPRKFVVEVVGPVPLPPELALVAVIELVDVGMTTARLARCRDGEKGPYLDAKALGTAKASYYRADALEGHLSDEEQAALAVEGALELPLGFEVPGEPEPTACGRVVLTDDAIVWQAGFWERGEFVEAQLPMELLGDTSG
jgi:hypothetical protein